MEHDELVNVDERQPVVLMVVLHTRARSAKQRYGSNDTSMC